MKRVRAILIAGPTASGKSALALDLARRGLGGPIVNADAMQVYRDLRVLTARPTAEEESQARHALYGHVDAAVTHSVGRFLAEATRLLEGLGPDVPPPIFVGGTGLYFKSLTDGLSALPAVPDEVRATVRADSDGRPTPELHAELARRDPAGAERLRPSDRQRVLRALEVLAATGRSILSFQGDRQPGPLQGLPTIRLFLAGDRLALRAAIDGRFERMLASGALDEVRALAARGLDPALPVMRAHGVPGLLAHGRGEIGLAEASARGAADTRAYAKRQITWFRHQMPGWEAVPPERALDAVAAALAAISGP